MTIMKKNPNHPKSEFYGVHVVKNNSRSKGAAAYYYRSTLMRDGVTIINKNYSTEREAAKAVDMCLIKRGEEPKNVMKRLTPKRENVKICYQY